MWERRRGKGFYFEGFRWCFWFSGGLSSFLWRVLCIFSVCSLEEGLIWWKKVSIGGGNFYRKGSGSSIEKGSRCNRWFGTCIGWKGDRRSECGLTYIRWLWIGILVMSLCERSWSILYRGSLLLGEWNLLLWREFLDLALFFRELGLLADRLTGIGIWLLPGFFIYLGWFLGLVGWCLLCSWRRRLGIGSSRWIWWCFCSFFRTLFGWECFWNRRWKRSFFFFFSIIF